MQGDRETPAALTTVKCTYNHDKLLLRNPPLEVTLTSNEGHLLLSLIEGVTDKEDLIRRVWGDRGLIVSDSSYYKALHTLRHYLSEVGLDRTVLKTLPRRGVVLLIKIESIVNENNFDTLGDDTVSAPANYDPIGSTAALAQAPLPPDMIIETSETIVNQIQEPGSASAHTGQTTNKDGPFKKYLFYSSLFLAFALPAYYADMLFSKPVQLEKWRLLSQSPAAKLYVEQGDKTPEDYIVSSMAIFGPAVGTTGSNYYVKKTLSELLVSCEKPESKGEALCTNYLIIEQKK